MEVGALPTVAVFHVWISYNTYLLYIKLRAGIKKKSVKRRGECETLN